jgi:F0F1-type ATP synthase assembly protein I
MTTSVKGEIEMKLDQANAQIRAQQEELKKLRSEMKKTQKESDTTGDSLNKQARMARSELSVFGAQGAMVGKLAQGFTSLAGPVGLVGAAVMGVGVAWNAVSSEIEEAKKRAEEFKKSMDKLDEGAVKESGSRATEAQKAAESNAGLALIYKDPEKMKREMQKKYGFTQEQAGGIMGATAGIVKKMPKENRETAMESIAMAVIAAQLGGGIDPVVSAKSLASNPSAMKKALNRYSYDAAARVTGGIMGFKITPEEIEANVQAQRKKPEVIESFRERVMGAPKEPIAEPFDLERKRIENRRKMLVGTLRGGDEAAKFLEDQQKQLRENQPTFFQSLRGFDKRGVDLQLMSAQGEDREKLRARLSEQNPEIAPDKITAILSEMTEVIRLNTISNAELKKSIDANNDKTKENTSATKDATSEGATGLKK